MPARSCRFGALTIAYDERVLEPRPWTLLQSEWAATLASEAAGASPGPLLELCAGAGQIGLAAAARCGRALVQVERDPVAAAFARANAVAAGMAHRVEVRSASIDQALSPDERFSLVMADPPYLRSADLARFPDDPTTAIDGGPDGLEVVRACLVAAADHLEQGGSVLLQVAGAGQAAEVAAFAGELCGLAVVEVRSHDDERAVARLAAT